MTTKRYSSRTLVRNGDLLSFQAGQAKVSGCNAGIEISNIGQSRRRVRACATCARMKACEISSPQGSSLLLVVLLVLVLWRGPGA